MSEERKKPKSWFWFQAAILSAFTLYPLSFGPACWLVGMGWLPATLAGVVYYPVAGSIVLLWIAFPQSVDAILSFNLTATGGFFEMCLSVGLMQGGMTIQ